MNAQSQTTPAVYVGTYAKYNDGNLSGAWLDLTDYSDKDEFIRACEQLHADEDDPELMFQDFQDIPEGLIGESWISEGVWDWIALSQDDKDMVAAYFDAVGNGQVSDGFDVDEIRDAFVGCYENEAEFAEQLINDCYSAELDALPDFIRNYINYADLWACELRFDYATARRNGQLYVF